MFSRSRPWRTRGPSFGSRAGARRRGRRDDDPTIGGCAIAQHDLLFDDDGTSDYVASSTVEESSAASVFAPLPAPYVPAARIDESGLRALARRALEQGQFQQAEHLSQPPVESLPADPLLQLLTRQHSDLMEIPHPRRSA